MYNVVPKCIFLYVFIFEYVSYISAIPWCYFRIAIIIFCYTAGLNTGILFYIRKNKGVILFEWNWKRKKNYVHWRTRNVDNIALSDILKSKLLKWNKTNRTKVQVGEPENNWKY